MLKQCLRKRARILRGLYRRFMRRDLQKYDSRLWWDAEFFTRGVSDRQTISPNKNVLVARYHYASVELLILRHLRNEGYSLRAAKICDLGCGAGHWMDFYRSLGAAECTGIDISQKAAEFLRQRYQGVEGVRIYHGRLAEVLATLHEEFDLVNAIGVMFHLVDDQEWEQTVRLVGSVLRPGGLFVASGHFGWLDNLDVQVQPPGTVVKRLRSASHWKRLLVEAGFDPRKISIYRNWAYLFINGLLPENNVLIAEKKSVFRITR